MSIQEMRLNKKQKKLLENTEREAREWLQTSSRYLFEEDVEYELRLLGQYNIIEKNAGYPEWISSNSLSTKIYNIIKKMNFGDMSQAIIKQNTILFLKLND